MRFLPNYPFYVLREDEYPYAIEVLEGRLADYRHEGFFDTFDGRKLYYEYFLAEGSKASIVLVHGLSEFTKKFYELVYYFLQEGYNVFLYDQRCHGRSDRLTDEPDLLHVDRFDDYVRDLENFVETVVLPTEDKPLYIYAHSMGGAISALYMARHPQKVTRAVLSAPMFEPTVGNVPMWLARASVRLSKWLCGSKAKFRLSREFNPDVSFRPGRDGCEVRFYHNMQLRQSDPSYQGTPMSNGWVLGSLTLRRRILSRAVAGKLAMPILLLSAERDTVVKNDAHRAFAARCPSCRLVTVPNASHGLLAADSASLYEMLLQVMEFYRS